MAIGDLKLKSSNLINTWDGFANDNTGTPALLMAGQILFLQLFSILQMRPTEFAIWM